MKHLLPLSLLFLFGCPVEPKDIQDLNNNEGPGKPEGQKGGGQAGNGPNGNGQGGNPNMGGQGNMGQAGGPNGNGQGGNPNMGGQEMGGLPPGAPTGDLTQGPLPEGQQPVEDMANGEIPDGGMPPNGDGNGTIPEGGQPPQGSGDTVPSLPLGEGEQNTQDPQFAEAPLGDVPATLGAHGDVKTPEGTHPTPDFAHQPGEIPATAGDVLPMYQQAPTFADFMGDEQITIALTVDGAAAFDFEFVVKREGDGRIYPKVIHKQSDATSPVTITAPATMDEPVWLVITADKTGDGPTPDDLVGGTTEALLFAGTDMSLSYSLQADDSFMQSLPWFSQAQGSDGPDFER
jgi:hypothetical protein